MVFTDPEVAAVGLTRVRAERQGRTVASVELDLADAIARPWTYELDPQGHLGLLADPTGASCSVRGRPASPARDQGGLVRPKHQQSLAGLVADHPHQRGRGDAVLLGCCHGGHAQSSRTRWTKTSSMLGRARATETSGSLRACSRASSLCRAS
ncbi:MAG TPA: hypothetical protein VFE14_12520, partial [Micromonosporaceae bacterium]|nr:hypothetical protein [Micromonosporaceae bacterium]